MLFYFIIFKKTLQLFTTEAHTQIQKKKKLGFFPSLSYLKLFF